ncbi:MAG TPA: TlyA family RNA methyltransferase, partial [Thermoanaerobaculia bacterium]|nr:TlyA family RNA methyltransferase [Thermoanaerobaculia bacterium]
RVDKPGTAVGGAVALAVAAREPFVSRAGRKLAHALDHFAIDPAGWVCLDVGASTGGFTHCLLERGARRVYALDVGRGQLDQRLRGDPRVVVMEGLNARHLAVDALPEACDLITVDVSFISLDKVVPALLPHLRAADPRGPRAAGPGIAGPAIAGPGAAGAGAPGGDLLVLIKPQFEAGRGAVGKGGILRDEALRRQVVADTAGRLAALSGRELAGDGWFDSPVAGTGGNREAFALLRRRES